MSAEEMRYGMLGDDQETAEEKLAKYTGEVDWSYLKEHCENGSLFFVDPTLKLEVVGEEKIVAWLKSGEMVKLEALHAAQWEVEEESKDEAKKKPQFEALVVSPFVLCRPIS